MLWHVGMLRNPYCVLIPRVSPPVQRRHLYYMNAPLPSSLYRAHLGAFSLLIALLVAPPPALAAEEKSEIQIISMDDAVRKELMKLNEALDVNPKLEEDLRNNLD